VRIVNDLADEIDAPIGKLPPPGMRNPARSTPWQNPNSRARRTVTSSTVSVNPLAQNVDDPSRVVRRDVILDLGLQPKALR
jgi:hypothetical protein